VPANPRVIGSSRRPRKSCFQPLRSGFFDRPSPDPCESGSFSCASSPLRSSFAVPPGRSLSGRPLLPGFRPSSRHQPTVSTWRGSSRFHYVPSSGFLNLSTVCATTGFAGLFHPAATSRVTPSRGFFRPAAVSTRRRQRAPVPLPPTRSPTLPSAATVEWTDFEALLRGPARSQRLVLTALSAVPLFGFFLPQVNAHPT
jgi:hypothetical protein